MPIIEPSQVPGVGAGRERWGPEAGVTARQPAWTSSYIKRFYSIHVTPQIWNVLGGVFPAMSQYIYALSHTHKKKCFLKKKSLARIIYEYKMEICGNFILTLKASNT